MFLEVGTSGSSLDKLARREFDGDAPSLSIRGAFPGGPPSDPPASPATARPAIRRPAGPGPRARRSDRPADPLGRGSPSTVIPTRTRPADGQRRRAPARRRGRSTASRGRPVRQVTGAGFGDGRSGLAFRPRDPPGFLRLHRRPVRREPPVPFFPVAPPENQEAHGPRLGTALSYQSDAPWRVRTGRPSLARRAGIGPGRG